MQIRFVYCNCECKYKPYKNKMQIYSEVYAK